MQNMGRLVICLGSILISTTALSQQFDWEPNGYAGAALRTSNNKITKYRNSIARTDDKPYYSGNQGNGSLFVGTQLSKLSAVEIGYDWFSKTSQYVNFINYPNTALKHQSSNLYLDILGYLPADEHFSLLGTLGVGHLTTKLEGRFNGVKRTELSGTSSQLGLRFGFGFQYRFDIGVGTRLMLRHQRGNAILNSMNSLGLGVFYYF